MITLYTVNMTTKKLISQFDSRGNKIGDYEEKVSVSFHDLPLQTAKMYEEKNPGCVEIVAQAQTYGDRRQITSGGAYKPRAVNASPASSKRPAASKPAASKHDAARTGDLAAALNQQ